jgi:hypothetical protein
MPTSPVSGRTRSSPRRTKSPAKFSPSAAASEPKQSPSKAKPAPKVKASPALALPKIKPTKSGVLSGISALGGLLLAYAAMGSRLQIEVPTGPVTFLNFAVATGAAYGGGFLLVPKFLIDINFSKSPDKYHIFFARFIGFLMCLLSHMIHTKALGADTSKFAAIMMSGCAFLGPTYAGLKLNPKQTPAGHMPAHVIMLVAGILAATE